MPSRVTAPTNPTTQGNYSQPSTGTEIILPPSRKLTFNNKGTVDPDEFNQDLRNALDYKHPTVDVALTQNVEPENGEMPSELNKWILAIQDSGGKVDYESVEANMDPMTVIAVLGFAFKAYEFGKNWYKEYKVAQQAKQSLFNAAKNYNAKLCYLRYENNMVTKVVFVDRNKPSDQPVCIKNTKK